MKIVSDETGRYLLALARLAVKESVTGKKQSMPEPPPGCETDLARRLGMFVTLKTHGDLRGCIGVFSSDTPVVEQVVLTAKDSTLNDYRFAGNRIRSSELDALEIDISLLSEIEETDVPESIEIGTHGIIVTGLGRYAGRRGVFLPQVATEHQLDVETFWNWVCTHKAGLPEAAWKDPSVCKREIFTAQVIS